jgi:hypothetical protein
LPDQTGFFAETARLIAEVVEPGQAGRCRSLRWLSICLVHM